MIYRGMASLFDEAISRDFPAWSRARNGDPDTSHAAAQDISDPDSLRRRQMLVLEVLLSAGKTGITDESLSQECLKRFGWSPTRSTARTRRSELAEMGYLEECGTAVLSSGKRGRIWRVCAAYAHLRAERVAAQAEEAMPE